MKIIQLNTNCLTNSKKKELKNILIRENHCVPTGNIPERKNENFI